MRSPVSDKFFLKSHNIPILIYAHLPSSARLRRLVDQHVCGLYIIASDGQPVTPPLRTLPR